MKKKLLLLVSLVVLSLSFCGCGERKSTLHIYSWADYISPELIEQFEKENNCRVVYDTFDSNEALLSKIQAGAGGYDIIIPSHYVTKLMAKSGALMKLDHSKLNMLQDLDSDYVANLPDATFEYTIPYTMSFTGIGYNKEFIKDFKPSWNQFKRNDLQKRTTLLDDKHEVIGAALLTLGMNPNTTKPEDLEKAKALLATWTPNIAKFENEQYKNGIASKEFFLVMGYSGDMVQILEENPHVGFVIPEEGCMVSTDVLAIPSSAKNVELAYKFMNFFYEPKNCAVNMQFTCYHCPLKTAYPYLPEKFKNNPAIFVSKELMSRSRFIEDLGEQEAVWNEFWEKIKTGK